MSLRFSVVINTYNRGALLGDALQGLSALDYPDFEVIVVNGPSTDNTPAVLARWAGSIKIGSCPEPNLSMSRNVGIAMASGDVVCFIDDDAVPHPTWLTRLATHYRDERVGAVGGFTIDNTGVSFQARKTVCDRYGNARYPSDYFDERTLCFPGTPWYPSLLGTNSSFRRSALQEIGGFDHAYAYLLDETDVCLRLVDSSYAVVYEPDALVYHQFAPSHIRSARRIAKTLYPSAVSKSYFIQRHGSVHDPREAIAQIGAYRDEILRANRWLADHGEISQEHRVSLDDDLLFGIDEGRQRAYGTLTRSGDPRLGDLSPLPELPAFKPMPRSTGLRIALVSKSFPPRHEAGIARWSWMMASGLAARGHVVHVLILAADQPYTRYENGYWTHAIREDHSEQAVRRAALLKLPAGLGPWCTAVEHELKRLKTFGVEVVSFPIWDLEGLAAVGDPDLGVVMSLHTTYAMAAPFKREWQERLLFRHFHVDKVIAAERSALARVPTILANSNAIVDDLQHSYGVDFRERMLLAPHGTLDPWAGQPAEAITAALQLPADRLRVSYVGRFEARKGFDIAVQVLARLLEAHPGLEINFIGDVLDAPKQAMVRALQGGLLIEHPQVHFKGVVERAELDALYRHSDLVLMPSRYESFGLVAIEAMAAGAPVVALAVGGLKEVVEDGVSGHLVPLDEHTAERTGDVMLALLRDRPRLQALKHSARGAFLQRFGIAQMVEKAEIAYRRAQELRT